MKKLICNNSIMNEFNDFIEINLDKCEVMNFIDIKDEFVSSKNIKQILNILKNYNQKKLIIFNDVDYLNYDDVVEYFQFFNFLYFVNNSEENYLTIKNYDLYLIDYDYLEN